MGIQVKKLGGYSLVWVAGLYIAVVAVAVIYSWAKGVHPFDLSLTVSLYVALHYWTTVLYFIGASIICTLLFLYVLKSKARMIQKGVYGIILICVFACAWFPCNKSRSVLTTGIHDFFAYSLVILMSLSFLLLAFFARNKQQRVFSFCSILYAAFFIASFVFDFAAFQNTIFIWENLMIALFFSELYWEKSLYK